MPIVLIKIVIALSLDQILGEPKKALPLVSFGHLAHWVELRLNRGNERKRLRNGLMAWTPIVLPFMALAWLAHYSTIGYLVDCVLLYLAVGRNSLFEHSVRVHDALQQNDLENARFHTSMIVSLDTGQLDHAGYTRATIESVLDNANDSIIGALLWFVVAGAPSVVLYRLANTLDALWGYRTERFEYFGKSAAHIDYVLNLIPARLCALAYVVADNTALALDCWRTQASLLKSPNGVPVMTTRAGAEGLDLGGPASYLGQLTDKPRFGGARTPDVANILRSNHLVDRALMVLLILIGVAAWL